MYHEHQLQEPLDSHWFYLNLVSGGVCIFTHQGPVLLQGVPLHLCAVLWPSVGEGPLRQLRCVRALLLLRPFGRGGGVSSHRELHAVPRSILECSGACVGTPHLCHQHPQPSPGRCVIPSGATCSSPSILDARAPAWAQLTHHHHPPTFTCLWLGATSE